MDILKFICSKDIREHFKNIDRPYYEDVIISEDS